MDYFKIILPTGQNDYLCRTMLDGELCEIGRASCRERV